MLRTKTQGCWEAGRGLERVNERGRISTDCGMLVSGQPKSRHHPGGVGGGGGKVCVGVGGGGAGGKGVVQNQDSSSLGAGKGLGKYRSDYPRNLT